LAIPETEYSSIITLNAGEFTKICKELYSLNETLTLTTHPSFVQFSVDSEAGSGSIKLGQKSGGDDSTTIEVSEGVTQ